MSQSPDLGKLQADDFFGVPSTQASAVATWGGYIFAFRQEGCFEGLFEIDLKEPWDKWGLRDQFGICCLGHGEIYDLDRLVRI